MSEVSSARPDGNVIRTADLLGAFSLATDLAMGLHTEHGARSCYIGMHIAQQMELPLQQRTDLYYAELLKDAGCTTYTSQLASSWLVDELTAKRDLQFFRDPAQPLGCRLMAHQVRSGRVIPPNPGHSYAGLPGKGAGIHERRL